MVDTSAGADAVEVLATPVDPVRLGAGRATSAAPRAADSLDALYQRERAALNAEALALRDADRHSRRYDSTYRAHERRVAAATALRAERDRLRRRDDSIPAPATRAHGASVASVDSALRADGRHAVRAPIAHGTASIELPAGTWWVMLVRRGGALRLPATQHTLRAGAHDTLRID